MNNIILLLIIIMLLPICGMSILLIKTVIDMKQTKKQWKENRKEVEEFIYSKLR